MASFRTILIANRGEIACRIISAARAQGYATVAVYSDADAMARHVLLADRSVRIGPPAAADSYLSIEALLTAAKDSGADAIHPGYGFLSENAEFAEACTAAGLTFVGPPAEAIRAMGNKAAAKRLMVAAAVPCVPGYQGLAQDDPTLIDQARRIGFPVMVKAAAGGGGRGMRLVHQEGDLMAALASARSEAASAFGSDELILEKAVIRPRHVEIQIAADSHANVIHLGERDCSVQRRHQKVIEEAPCPVMTPELRTAMGQAAVQAARSIDYRGVGTVEFLLDEEANFYFLEMNTRIQVEHPVTELVTGVDLVGLQLDVAAGLPLRIAQDEVVMRGHAIEARLYAEDPAAGFLPQTGRIELWRPAEGAGVRIDHGLNDGDQISPFYDPMQAKIIAYGSNREEARRRLLCALDETALLGVATNKSFLTDILDHPAFVAGEATTGFLADHLPAPGTAPQNVALIARALTAALLFGASRRHGELSNWWSSGAAAAILTLETGTDAQRLHVSVRGAHYTIETEASEITIELLEIEGHRLRFRNDGKKRWARFAARGPVIHVEVDGFGFRLEDVTFRPAAAAGTNADGVIRAPMNGVVTMIHEQPGTAVEKGAPLLVLEAMKMEHTIHAPCAGTIEELRVRAGEQVATRQVLVILAADEGTAA
jgi:geranyl-CoA carboxylase alpha subunit